tara:strand:+ start:19274 stop:19651 length:378 start_codon:yes stop_codon:yes gene_type:complete
MADRTICCSIDSHNDSDKVVTNNKWVINLLEAIEKKYYMTLILSFCVFTLIGSIMLKLGYITVFIGIISETLSDSLHSYILENIRKTAKYEKIENDNVMTFSFIVMFIIHFVIALSVIGLEKLLS